MLKKYINIILIVFLLIILGTNYVIAQNNDLKVEIKAAFQDEKAAEGWMPLNLIVRNNNTNYFHGSLELIVKKRDIFSDDQNEEIRIFEKDIKLEGNSQKDISLPLLYKRNYFAKPIVILKNKINDEIIIEKSIDIKVDVNYGYNILVINQAGSGYDFLENHNLADANSNNIYYLSANNMPEHWLAYREMDLIILGEDNYNQLKSKQIKALKNWLSMDNTILISGEGDFFSYHSLLMEELFPFTFVKKELIEIDNSLANIWLLKNENGEEIINNGEIPQILKYKRYKGNIIFASLEPLSINKKENFYLQIIPEKIEKGQVDYGFLKDYEENFLNEINYQYSYLIYLIPIFILYFIFIFFIYQKLNEESFGVKKFLLFFIIFISIFSTIFYFSLGKNIIKENNILSEIAIIEMNKNNNRVFVESYLGYKSHPLMEIGFFVKNDNAFLIQNKNLDSDEDKTSLKLNEENIIFKKSENNTWQSGNLRSYYFSEFALSHELFKKNSRLNLKLENESNINIKHIYIYYDKQWYDIDGLNTGEKAEIELYYKDNIFRGNRYRVYNDVINMNGYLTEDIINKVVDEVISYRIDIQDKVFIFGLLEGNELKGSVNFIENGKKLFSGIFYLPLDLKNIR